LGHHPATPLTGAAELLGIKTAFISPDRFNELCVEYRVGASGAYPVISFERAIED
jgi:hypothetical protein